MQASWFLAPYPVRALFGEGIVHISAGPVHAVAVSEGGDVYVWGDATAGRLGNGDVQGEVEFPTMLPPDSFPSHVVRAPRRSSHVPPSLYLMRARAASLNRPLHTPAAALATRWPLRATARCTRGGWITRVSWGWGAPCRPAALAPRIPAPAPGQRWPRARVA